MLCSAVVEKALTIFADNRDSLQQSHLVYFMRSFDPTQADGING